MKAIRVHEFGEPDVMKLEEVPDLTPDAGQVLVAVKAAGVNPVEAYIRSGRYGEIPRPFTPGNDAAGVVAAVGAEVTRVHEGDRVYAAGTLTGSYAEQTLCTEAQVRPLPDNVSFSQGATLWIPYGTAYRALFQRGMAVPGETVLVHGASGGVGMAAVQFARAAGMRVIGTAGSQRGRQLLADQGVPVVWDHTDPAHLQQAAEATEGRGIDVILEMRAEENLARDLPALAASGRLVVIGARGPVQELSPRDLFKEIWVTGVYLTAAKGKELEAIHAATFAGLSNGTLRPVVGEEIPLAEAPRAHHTIMEESAYGKLVLVP
ncbi:MAG TPA: NADPH:quinone reductase [Armatimonadota bacterium]|jgi:NADPH2:quinone reductase